jgi:predicted MPP superfamily phosphohydrolase
MQGACGRAAASCQAPATGLRRSPCNSRNFGANPGLTEPAGRASAFGAQQAREGIMDLQLAEKPRDRIGRPIDWDVLEKLEQRLGRVHARQRLGIEDEEEGRVFGRGINFFHPENSYLSPWLIRSMLKLTGLYWRARRNAENVQIRHHEILLHDLPISFDGFTILQISDLHVDMNKGAMQQLIELLPTVAYDACVLTGDYRGKTYGPFDATITGLARVRAQLRGPVFGVLGNHDTIRMVPALEKMGIQLLLNESEPLVRGAERIHLVGIDDAHYYRVDNIEKATEKIAHAEFAILLSHTPEIYRQAAHAGFKLLLSGHTHGGQLCLPGAIPITLDAVLPRRMGAGPWRYHDMVGYTSVGVGSCIVAARINCPPEITLHRLRYCGRPH